MHRDPRDYFSSVVIGAALVLSIIVAWVAILVPSHAAASLHSEGKSIAVTALIVSDTARKGNRLGAESRTIEYDVRSVPPAAAMIDARVPVGCDVAFSKLVKSKNVAVRCITSVATSVKVAQATDRDRAL